MNLTEILIRKRSVYPFVEVARGESKTTARQLDVTLMESGFKLSAALLNYLGACDFTSAIGAANEILLVTKNIVGAHVKHNPYFQTFPREIPDTVDFWIRCIFRYYVADECWYGEHRHSYDEMVAQHAKLALRDGAALKVIDLGGSLDDELRRVFTELAGSTIPLNPQDRDLLALLFERGIYTDTSIRIRENKAIINGLKLRKGMTIDVDTVVDVLRIACFLSDGDVTLAEATKFKSPSRSLRRILVGAIDELVARDHRKVDDVAPYKERFKRLAEKLHPREYPQFKHAARVFDFAGGAIAVETFGRRVHKELAAGLSTQDFLPTIDVLVSRPGMLLKNVDLILRSGDRRSIERLLASFIQHASKISGRNLLNLYQHLLNRAEAGTGRIFVNRHGRGFATGEKLPALAQSDVEAFQAAILRELESRLPAVDSLVVDWASLEGVAVPISEKSKSDGFAVLPRGSTFPVALERNGSLRFFVYWKQRVLRTDYDLSCAFYDAEFQMVTQISWTNLRDNSNKDAMIVHSGDFTDAAKGATEFIDIQTECLDSRIKYIIPSINYYTGEDFATAEEAFFGYMQRPGGGRGLPFEAKTVSTKFALKGTGKVCLPMIFVREGDGIMSGRWLDIYARGLSWANRVEAHTFTTVGLAKAILEKTFLPLSELVRLYERKAVSVLAANGRLPKTAVTYVGLRRPEGMHPDSTFYTLESFRALIPG